MTIWDIKPLVGLGPVLFGMTEAEVAALTPALGPLTARQVDADGTVNEHRGVDLPTISYRGGKVCYLAAGVAVPDVTWQGVNAYQMAPRALLQALEVANGGAEVGLGTVWFKDLGVDTIGFYFEKTRRFFVPGPRQQDDRTISLFDRAMSATQGEQLAPHYRATTFLKK